MFNSDVNYGKACLKGNGTDSSSPKNKRVAVGISFFILIFLLVFNMLVNAMNLPWGLK